MKKRIKLLLFFSSLFLFCYCFVLSGSAAAATYPAGRYFFKDTFNYNSLPSTVTVSSASKITMHTKTDVYTFTKSGSTNAAIAFHYNSSSYFIGWYPLLYGPGRPDFYNGYIDFVGEWYIDKNQYYYDIFKDNYETVEIGIEYITNDTAYLYWDTSNFNNVVGFVLYKDNVIYQRLAPEIQNITISEYGSYQISVLYAGSAPEDPDEESEKSNTVVFSSDLPGVTIIDDSENQRIYWDPPETDKAIGSYMLYRNGEPMRDISETYVSYQDAGLGLIQVKVLYLFGEESDLSNVIRRALFTAVETVHLGNDGFVSFIPPVGEYSGYISGYSVFYSDSLISDDRSNEIQIIDNSFTLPSSSTFVIVTHYQFGDSAESKVFQYNQDLNYNLLNGISSGIDNLTGGMNKFIGGYEKPTVPNINPPIDEYSEFATDMIDSLNKTTYRADHFASNFSPYLAGFSFWGSIFDDIDDQEPIHDLLMIWASLAIFSLLFGGIVVSIVSSRPRKDEDRYQSTNIGFTAPVESEYRKAGFR